MDKRIILAFLLLLSPIATHAGEVKVISAEVVKISFEMYHISATLLHHDANWDHYADKWEVIGPNDVVLGTRTLLHPHVDEQPFTRNLSGVKIPNNIKEITIKAHDSVHGYGEKTVTLKLP